MSCLLDLSHELLHNIFINVDPADLAAISRSCSPLNQYVKGNNLLCKELYLQHFDRPVPDPPNWETELRSLVVSDKLLQSDDIDAKRESLQSVAKTICSLLSAPAATRNIDFLATHFKSQQNIDAFLTGSGLFEDAGSATQIAASSTALRQTAAKLHCLYGVSIDTAPSFCPLGYGIPSSRLLSLHRILYPNEPRHDYLTRSRGGVSSGGSVPIHVYARARVYDLRRYTEGSFWGPFRDDYSQDVDWEKAEAIMVVLSYNMRLYSAKAQQPIDPFWETPWKGATSHSCVSSDVMGIPRSLGAPGRLRDRDPYGVTGTWMRVVCFLDYNDLYAFNFAHRIPDDQPRSPIDTEEAIRLIQLKLRVAKIEPPEEDDGQDFPVVTFKGTSKSLHARWDPNANSKIRGTVRQTPQGEIRWTTFSIFHGEERWRSEGVQVGGIRSARGVLGNWFDKDYDVHGPAGPTAFWKTSEDASEEKEEDPAPITVMQMTMPGVDSYAPDEDEDEDDDE